LGGGGGRDGRRRGEFPGARQIGNRAVGRGATVERWYETRLVQRPKSSCRGEGALAPCAGRTGTSPRETYEQEAQLCHWWGAVCGQSGESAHATVSLVIERSSFRVSV